MNAVVVVCWGYLSCVTQCLTGGQVPLNVCKIHVDIVDNMRQGRIMLLTHVMDDGFLFITQHPCKQSL